MKVNANAVAGYTGLWLSPGAGEFCPAVSPLRDSVPGTSPHLSTRSGGASSRAGRSRCGRRDYLRNLLNGGSIHFCPDLRLPDSLAALVVGHGLNVGIHRILSSQVTPPLSPCFAARVFLASA